MPLREREENWIRRLVFSTEEIIPENPCVKGLRV